MKQRFVVCQRPSSQFEADFQAHQCYSAEDLRGQLTETLRERFITLSLRHVVEPQEQRDIGHSNRLLQKAEVIAIIPSSL